MVTATNSSAIPSQILILVALLQGFALLLLHQSIELKFWPYNQPQWLFAFYSVAIVAPILLLLGLSNKNTSVYKLTACYSLVLSTLGYYIGTQAIPLIHIRLEPLLFVFVVTLAIATFKALMYVQHFAEGGPLTYSQLFLLSWRNILTLGLSLLFTISIWGVLMLWAALFKAIKIDFFYDLFTERWFFYPILALANGFGVIIFRQQSNIIDTITRILQALMKFLLVILVFVSIIFLLTLSFTGLKPLWESGGSTLVLWMQALILFLTNAVYQDDPDTQPYKLYIHRFIYFGIALLPIYSMISFYGLSLRVEQYGWTVSRCWAFMLWTIFAAFSVGYLWGIIQLRDRWLHRLSWVNIRMGLVVLACMLIVNSPVLDFRKISVNSQVERLEAEKVSLTDFDYSYLRRDLAKPGYEALQDLKARIKNTHPEIAVRINSLYTNHKNKEMGSSKDEFLMAIKGVTDDLPSKLTDKIYRNMSANANRMKQNLGYYLINTDLNSDGRNEFILVEEHSRRVFLTMYYLRKGEWTSQNLRSVYNNRKKPKDRKERILKALEDGDFKSVKSQWQDLQIGEFSFQVP